MRHKDQSPQTFVCRPVSERDVAARILGAGFP